MKKIPFILRPRMLLLLVVNSLRTSNSASDNLYDFPGISDITYSQIGDINIGAIALAWMNSQTFPAGACSKDIKPLLALTTPEAIAFATKIVNNNPNLLPNVSLGFIIKYSCSTNGVALASSLDFLPRPKSEDMKNDSICSTEDHTVPDSHEVIGTLGPTRSAYAVTISPLYAAAHLPIVGVTEDSDELSNKNEHPYYFRVVPPNKYMVYAMLNFIASNGWSYVSMLYANGAYGQTAFDNLNRLASSYGVCIATNHRVFPSTDYGKVVSDLMAHSRARVVVLYIYDAQYQQLLNAIEEQNVVGQFILLGSTGLITYQTQNRTSDPALGTFIFEFFGEFVPAFYEYLDRQTVDNSKNPNMKQIWEYLFDCSFKQGTCRNDTSILKSSKLQPRKQLALYMDGVLAFAHAAHDLLKERCPDARGMQARACITGELLRAYLKNTSFEGFLGRVEFDENQEVKGKYIISQFLYDTVHVSDTSVRGSRILLPKQVGIYDTRSDTIEYTSTVSWDHFNTLYRIVPWSEGLPPIYIPESVCSGPCSVGEYMIEKEVPCCWECRKCRENERLVNNNTNCEVCPPFTWPDNLSGFTKCLDIPLTYPRLEDSIPIVITALTLLALTIYMLTLSGYIIYCERRVIKASSRELSSLQLLAILAGYVTILLFQMKPTNSICSAIYFLFCMSFVLLYAPLLVKTIRIFRIFQSGKTNNQQLQFISPASQLIITGCLVAVQITLCAVSYALFSPGVRRTQPIWSEKLVELSCDLTLPGLASFLGYNIVLVCLCSVFAFKVRKLPDNFNESQFIAMCVATTLLIWLAFIPTYFTASREYVRVFLLSSALLLNHSVALAFLFVPKIYAAAFIAQESGKLSDGKP